MIEVKLKVMKLISRRPFLDILHIWKTEYIRIFRSPSVFVVFFVATLLYPLLYGMVYKEEVLRDVPVAVVDRSNSSLSRAYIRNLDATPELKISDKCHSLDEAKHLFYQHKVHGILFISEDFTSQITNGRQTYVSAYFDMSSFVYYKTIMSSISIVSKEFGAQIQHKNLVEQGLTEQQASVAVNPLPYNGVALFNSGGGFASFLLPGILVLILYQTLMLGINVLAGGDWEENQMSKYRPMTKRYHGTLRIVLGKSLCYFTIYAVLAFYLFGFIVRLFNLPHIGSSWDLVIFMIPFLLSTIFLAMTLSICMRNLESAFLLLLFSTLPLLFLAGVSWPQTNIPTFWKAVSYLFPSTHGIQGYVRINTMTANLHEVSKEFFILWLQTGVYFITAWFSYRWLILHPKKSEK